MGRMTRIPPEALTESGSWLELRPVLSVWAGEHLIPLAQRIVEGQNVLLTDAQYGAVIVVVADKDEVSRRVMLENRLILERTDERLVVTRRVCANTDTG